MASNSMMGGISKMVWGQASLVSMLLSEPDPNRSHVVGNDSGDVVGRSPRQRMPGDGPAESFSGDPMDVPSSSQTTCLL